MSAIDQAFVRAITTIKTISRGPNALAKPPVERKAQLYGLYKQATEGDVKGIMPRPAGSDPQTAANQRKWDAWKMQEGLNKQEAKLKYVGYLLETMQALRVASPGAPLPPNWAELEQSYEAAKRVDPTEETGHRRRLSIGSVNSSYSQFLRTPAPPIMRPTAYSEFGLSDRDRSELQADQFVEKIQTNYPHVVPGAIGLGGGITDPAFGSRSYAAAAADAPQPPSDPHNDPIKKEIFSYLGQWFERIGHWVGSLVRRIAVDSACALSILLLVRAVSTRPQLMKRLPMSSKLFAVLGKVIALVLHELGIDLRIRAARSA